MSSDKPKIGHEIVGTPVYGPVDSRRYGLTVGINLMPAGEKVCNFSCVYCQLGMKRTPVDKAQFPDVPTVIQELKKVLQEPFVKNCKNLVISGNGEPTLHPDFATFVQTVCPLRDQLAPHLKIVCFTNGSRLDNPEIKKALAMLDECAVKFDPAMETANLPDLMTQSCIIKHSADLPNLVIQSCLFTGKISNISQDHLENWIRNLILIKPKRIDIYTIARQTAVAGLEPLYHFHLKNIASHLKKNLNLPVRVVD